MQDLENSDKAREIRTKFGAYPAILYWRLKRRKIFKPDVIDHFAEEFLHFFLKNAAAAPKSPSATEKIKNLVQVIPKLDGLKKLIKYHRFSLKNAIFFKISVDILTFYYKLSGSPLFLKYKTEVIPIALEIYQTLPAYTFSEISDKLIDYQTNSIFLILNILCRI